MKLPEDERRVPLGGRVQIIRRRVHTVHLAERSSRWTFGSKLRDGRERERHEFVDIIRWPGRASELEPAPSGVDSTSRRRRPKRVGTEDVEDFMSRNRAIEASEPAKATPTAALPHTDAVADVHERVLTEPSAQGRHIEAGPGQQIAREMARQWLAQPYLNAGARPGMPSAEHAEIKQLKAEIRRLRQNNATLKAAMVLLAGELDPDNN